MNILITGLTLHNNKGGPALAYSLVKKLQSALPGAQFHMAVPDFADNVEIENSWKSFYEISSVVGQIVGRDILPPYSFYRDSIVRREKYEKTLRGMDLIVDLTALSYMDLPHYSWRHNLSRNLSNFAPSYLAQKNGKSFLRWTQSYGPFNSYLTKTLVKRDLCRQQYIFARGEGSVAYLKQLLPDAKVFSFPDIAITLPRRTDYLEKYFADITKKTITISPSSVIYRMLGNKHISDVISFVKYIRTQSADFRVLLVPHNRLAFNASFYNCDLTICQEISDQLSGDIEIVTEDMDALNLKGIISQAHIHIGARYHSVIAALSSGVPTISMAWHNKYTDIMKMYGCERYITAGAGSGTMTALFDDLNRDHCYVQGLLAYSQNVLEKEIDRNLELFMEMIKVGV